MVVTSEVFSSRSKLLPVLNKSSLEFGFDEAWLDDFSQPKSMSDSVTHTKSFRRCVARYLTVLGASGIEYTGQYESDI